MKLTAPTAVGATARIRTADMSVTVRRAAAVATQADQADAIALRAGGEVDADERVGGAHATATVRLRVPPAALTAVLHSLSRLGHETARQVSSVDVTQRVADVSSREVSARDAIARLRQLYGQARKVSDVLAVETELTQREADLESVQAQGRALSRETSMAAVTVRLQAAAVASGRRHAARGGFVGGLQRGWHAFTAATAWLATALGAVLPFAVLSAILAGAGWLVWRRRPVAAASPPGEPA